MKGFAIDSPPALGNICSAFWMCFPSRTCFNKIITFSVVRKSSAIKYFFFSSTLKTCWPLVNEEVKKLCAHRVWLVLFFQKLLWWSQYDRLYQSRSSEQCFMVSALPGLFWCFIGASVEIQSVSCGMWVAHTLNESMKVRCFKAWAGEEKL